MKKLLFLAVVGFGGSMLVKGGHVALTPDNNVRIAQWTFPVPAAVQSSPVYGMVTTMLLGQIQSPSQASYAPGAGYPRYGAAPSARPAMPNVTSATSTYNANAPSGGQAQGTDQFSAVAKALH